MTEADKQLVERAFRAGFKAATKYDWGCRAIGHERTLEHDEYAKYARTALSPNTAEEK